LDISNAQLTLPSGNELRKNNPVEGITLVTLRNLNANSIQIRVRSETGLPQVKVSESKQGLLLSLTPAFQTGESSSALAPETPATQPEEEGEGDITVEEEEEIEILVTGEQETGYAIPETANVTRTNIPILNIPRSIQVVPEQVIEDQQVIRLEEALRNVSNVFQENTGGDRTERFTIRGFRTTNVLRDGFRQFGQAGFAETANLERIEVLKGPASILYGNTEPGGTINLVTKRPLPEPFVEPQLQVGSYDFFRPQIDATGPLTSDGSLL
jgi:iron complex outermembrane receptor protein